MSPIPAEIENFDPTDPSFWQRIKYPLRWLFFASVLVFAVVVFKRFDLAQYIDQKALRALIEPFGIWAPAVYISVFVLAMLLIFIPYSLFCILGVLLFGPVMGTLWAVIGGTLSALAVFWLSRLIGRKIIAKRSGDPRWENLNQRLRKDGFYYLLMVRALSIVPFNLLNFACAFVSIRSFDFLLANVIGLIPSAFVYGYGTLLILDPTTPRWQIIVTVVLVLLLVIVPMAFRHFRRQERQRRLLNKRRLIHEAFKFESSEESEGKP